MIKLLISGHVLCVIFISLSFCPPNNKMFYEKDQYISSYIHCNYKTIYFLCVCVCLCTHTCVCNITHLQTLVLTKNPVILFSAVSDVLAMFSYIIPWPTLMYKFVFLFFEFWSKVVFIVNAVFQASA